MSAIAYMRQSKALGCLQAACELDVLFELDVLLWSAKDFKIIQQHSEKGLTTAIKNLMQYNAKLG